MIRQSVSVEIDREMLVPQQIVGAGFRRSDGRREVVRG